MLQAANEPVFTKFQQSQTNFSAGDDYGSYSFHLTMLYRLEFLMRVLRAGYHFLSADLDTIWLSNPFDYISHDLSIAIQGQIHKGTKMSGGFIVVHATSRGRTLWQAIIDCHNKSLVLLQKQQDDQRNRPYSDFTEQKCINDRLSSTETRFLDSYLFPDGRSFFDLKLPQSRGIVPVVIRGNWLVGMEAKIKRLQSWNLLAGTAGSCDSLESGIPFNFSTKVTPVSIRVRVLTYNRLNSLQRLLKSLLTANYLNDSVTLDISIDRPSPEATTTEKSQWDEVISYLGDGAEHPPKFE